MYITWDEQINYSFMKDEERNKIDHIAMKFHIIGHRIDWMAIFVSHQIGFLLPLTF